MVYSIFILLIIAISQYSYTVIPKAIVFHVISSIGVLMFYI
jgi:hypothetical protein